VQDGWCLPILVLFQCYPAAPMFPAPCTPCVCCRRRALPNCLSVVVVICNATTLNHNATLRNGSSAYLILRYANLSTTKQEPDHAPRKLDSLLKSARFLEAPRASTARYGIFCRPGCLWFHPPRWARFSFIFVGTLGALFMSFMPCTPLYIHVSRHPHSYSPDQPRPTGFFALS
jgi:hypothetical protein